MGSAAAPLRSLPQADACPKVYRFRNPRATALFQLVEAHYEDVKRLWEDRFEKTHGRWRGFTDTVVARYLDCASPECGFARLRCDGCRSERLLLFSCRQRNICPSCDAKRAAAFAAFLHDEIFEDVPHSMWVFTIPKMLRRYFLHDRELLGELSRCAYETIKQLMSAAALEHDGFRPGMVSVVQTFGEAARFHPHVHTLCSRGGWNAASQWVPVPYLDHRLVEQLFRHRVLRLLKRQQLLSDERIELLLSWTRSGFSADDSVRIPAGEGKTLEHVARYMLRSHVSLSRTKWSPGSPYVLYQPRASHDDPKELFPRLETIDALEFLARVIIQIPEPRRHLLFYYGHYANVVRGRRRKIAQAAVNSGSSRNHQQEDEPAISPARKQALRRRWADLIRRVFELNPLLCSCGGTLRVVAFITEPRIIRKILDHLKKTANADRAPPPQRSQ
jgi:hypothetical protein